MKSLLSDKFGRISFLSVLFLLVLWELASMAAGSGQLLPGPVPVIRSAVRILCGLSFWKMTGATICRAAIGFSIAIALGLAAGIAGGLKASFRAFMKPWVVVLRSTPVIAFVLIAIVWFNAGSVPVLIGFLTMFPIIYINVAEGIMGVDPKAVEMGRFYGLRGRRLVKEIYIPAISPFLRSGVSTAVGIGWRAVIVGEVIGQPQWGIGSAMRSAQTFLQVDVLVAWTVAAVAVGAVLDRIVGIYGHKAE